jgi:hypothetical protein
LGHSELAELQTIAAMLIEARERLERLDLSRIPEGNRLHGELSNCHGLASLVVIKARFVAMKRGDRQPIAAGVD